MESQPENQFLQQNLGGCVCLRWWEACLPLKDKGNCQKKGWGFSVTFCVCVCGHCVVWVFMCVVYGCVHVWVYASFYRTVTLCVYIWMCVCHCMCVICGCVHVLVYASFYRTVTLCVYIWMCVCVTVCVLYMGVCMYWCMHLSIGL